MNGEPSHTVVGAISPEERYAFDQKARIEAIRLAARLMPEGTAKLSINFDPNALYDPVLCVRATLCAADETGFDLNRLMIEVTEHDRVSDTAHLNNIIQRYASYGFTTAIDDFGAGFAGLGLLAEFRPHIIKLDRKLVCGIDRDTKRQAILYGTLCTCRQLGIQVVAEGVERMEEAMTLRAAGVRLFQGFLFARPALEALPEVDVDWYCAEALPDVAGHAWQTWGAGTARGNA